MAKLHPAVSDKDQQTGNPDAGITLVEYGDYQCPHCGHAHPLIKKLVAEKGNEFLFVFRNFPLQQSHPMAFIAAAASEAAAKQNKFWPMHDIIFENQNNLSGETILDFAETLQLDMHQFAKDWKSDEVIAKVENDFESGIRSGVNGTPAFFLNGELLRTYDTTYTSLLNAIETAKQSLIKE